MESTNICPIGELNTVEEAKQWINFYEGPHGAPLANGIYYEAEAIFQGACLRQRLLWGEQLEGTVLLNDEDRAALEALLPGTISFAAVHRLQPKKERTQAENDKEPECVVLSFQEAFHNRVYGVSARDRLGPI